jgi:predicted amidophosphoribosyltransferase
MDLSSLFRNCKHCGLGIFANDFQKINFFCKKCWEKLESEKTKPHFVIYKTPEIAVRSLFVWREKESIVKDLIHGLKGGTPFMVLSDLARELSERYVLEGDTVIVPVPSSKVGEKDHAFIMAKIISESQGLEFWNGLEWKNKRRNQKFLNKTERFVSEMKMTQKLSSKKRVILIDDLVTTGATAVAAFKALKGLNQIEVWSLACRL